MASLTGLSFLQIDSIDDARGGRVRWQSELTLAESSVHQRKQDSLPNRSSQNCHTNEPSRRRVRKAALEALWLRIAQA
jgi:hypothetical protein